MAFTLGVGPVAAGKVGSTITLSLTGTTAGRSLVLGVIYLSSATLNSVTCSGGESDLTLHGATANATSGVSAQMASLGDIVTGGDKTITVNFAADPSFALAFVLEAAGGDIASFFDAGAGATGNDTTPTVSVTASADNALIVAIAHNESGVPTAGGAYVSVTVGTQTVGEYDLDAGAAGAKTVDFSSVSGQWAVRAAAFNAAIPTNDAAFNLPIITLSAAGHRTQAAEFNLPMLTLLAGTDGGIFNLPVAALSAAGAMTFLASVAFNLPMLTLSAVGVNGSAGSGVIRLPLISLAAAGIDSSIGIGTPALPVLQLSAAGLTNGLGSSALSLPILLLSATGATGGYGTAVINLPLLTLSIAAVQSVIGTATFSLPVLYLSAQGAAALTAAYKTWVLNTKKGALTEYDSFSFNSFALFQGAVLAAGPNGVFTLGTQALDDTTAIDALVRTARSNYDKSLLMRIPRIYLGHETDGDLLFRTITSENGTRTYQLIWNHVTGEQIRRIPVGKGPKSAYWQHEIANVSGSDFDIQNILVYPTLLRRRVM